MSTRLMKTVFAIICGMALGAGRCNQEPVEPSQPPQDVEPEVQPDDSGMQDPSPVPPESEVVDVYGPPEDPPDQPLYGVPY